jgi:hypothetical protein
VSRAYLRLDPRAYEKKVIQQGYPLPLFAAFVGALCESEHQPDRGRYRSERVLRATLEEAARHIPELIRRGDLVPQPDGSLYVDGWDEWQEGDWKVAERVRRIRDRRRAETAEVTDGVTEPVTAGVTPDVTVGDVYTPSDGGRQSVIDSGSGSGRHRGLTRPSSSRGARANGRVHPAEEPTTPEPEPEKALPWL